MPRPTRLSEYREGGFNPLFRRWTLLLYSEPAACNSAPPLARAVLDVREDPDSPGCLLVAVRGDVRVTLDVRAIARVRDAGRAALSSAARDSAKSRRCPSCNRGGGLGAMPGGGRKCRWCSLVVEGVAA